MTSSFSNDNCIVQTNSDGVSFVGPRMWMKLRYHNWLKHFAFSSMFVDNKSARFTILHNGKSRERERERGESDYQGSSLSALWPAENEEMQACSITCEWCTLRNGTVVTKYSFNRKVSRKGITQRVRTVFCPANKRWMINWWWMTADASALRVAHHQTIA